MEDMASDGRDPNEPQGRALAVVRGRAFNFFTAAVIGANTIYLGFETDFADSESELSTNLWFYIEIGFTLIFFIELLLRLFAERGRFFHDRWNGFDSVLVLITCLDTFIIEHIVQDSGHTDFVSIGRIIRLVRMARIIRLLRFFRTLWLLIIGVVDAMRTLVWAWVLITIITFVFSIFMTRALGLRHGDENPDVEEQFGRVENSMFTLFQVMTLEGWPTIARNAMDYEPWIWVIFIVFLLTTTFSIMNVIVAVIVEGTLEQAHDRTTESVKPTLLDKAELDKVGAKISEMFCATDANSDGQVSKEEFMSSLHRQDVISYLSDVGIDMRQAENLFDILDYDNSGSLDADEYSRGVLKARGEAQAKDVLGLQCELWRYELKIKEELQTLCIRVNTDMAKVDEEVDLLRLDISRLGGMIGNHSVQARVQDSSFMQSRVRTTDSLPIYALE